ncbi:MAG: NAD(+)/NADH kinase [Candidatus Kapaibacteriota bacterium]|jgi:NAD+ kinase
MKIGIYESTGRTEVLKWAANAAKKIKTFGNEVYCTNELKEKLVSDDLNFVKTCNNEDLGKLVDVVITFGGDGTMLSAANLLLKYEVPILGFNIGKLGFLAEFSINDLDLTIKNIVNGDYRIVERAVLETEVLGKKIYALNDFVLEKKNSTRLVTIECFSNRNHIADYRADGVILTTPTGSTAYSLSSGGPIIAPSTDVFCITPVCPHSLTLRPIVIPDNVEVTFRVKENSNEVNLVADGKNQVTLKENDFVLVKKSQYSVKLIKPLESSYYDVLKAKLLWATGLPENKIDIKEPNI